MKILTFKNVILEVLIYIFAIELTSDFLFKNIDLLTDVFKFLAQSAILVFAVLRIIYKTKKNKKNDKSKTDYKG